MAGSKTTRLRLAGFVFTWVKLAGVRWLKNPNHLAEMTLAGFVFTWLKLAGSKTKTTRLRLAGVVFTWLKLAEVGWACVHLAEVG